MKIERKENLIKFSSVGIDEIFACNNNTLIKTKYNEEYDSNCFNFTRLCLDNCTNDCLVKHYPNAKLVLED